MNPTWTSHEDTSIQYTSNSAELIIWHTILQQFVHSINLLFTHWRSFKFEIDIRIKCKFVPSIQILWYFCGRKRPLNISFTPLYIGESGYHIHFH